MEGKRGGVGGGVKRAGGWKERKRDGDRKCKIAKKERRRERGEERGGWRRGGQSWGI